MFMIINELYFQHSFSILLIKLLLFLSSVILPDIPYLLWLAEANRFFKTPTFLTRMTYPAEQIIK